MVGGGISVGVTESTGNGVRVAVGSEGGSSVGGGSVGGVIVGVSDGWHAEIIVNNRMIRDIDSNFEVFICSLHWIRISNYERTLISERVNL